MSSRSSTGASSPLWQRRCHSRTGYQKHSPFWQPVRGGGRELRCNYCDRTYPELEALYR